MKPITRTQCPENLRHEFLPKAVGKYFHRYEMLTLAFMDKACENYDRGYGYWNSYNLSNGGFYMSIRTEDRLKIQWPDNFFKGEMSADAAGIGVSLFAQNALCWEAKSERFNDQFYALRDYAAQHEEASLIFGFID